MSYWLNISLCNSAHFLLKIFHNTYLTGLHEKSVNNILQIIFISKYPLFLSIAIFTWVKFSSFDQLGENFWEGNDAHVAQ